MCQELFQKVGYNGEEDTEILGACGREAVISILSFFLMVRKLKLLQSTLAKQTDFAAVLAASTQSNQHLGSIQNMLQK